MRVNLYLCACVFVYGGVKWNVFSDRNLPCNDLATEQPTDLNWRNKEDVCLPMKAFRLLMIMF